MSRNHTYSRRRGQHIEVFNVSRLWKLTSNLPVSQRATAELNESASVWFNKKRPTIGRVVRHIRKILDVDLSYPIILSADDCIMDGYHRFARALLESREFIDVVRFEIDPEPDQILAVTELEHPFSEYVSPHIHAMLDSISSNSPS